MKNPTSKNHMLTAAVIAALLGYFGALSAASAQTAVFNYSDGVGAANAGTYFAGDSFTFSINLGFTAGGAVVNLEGLSYWLQQQTAGPFNFTLTGVDTTSTPFSDAQTPSLVLPQALNPSNASDLGGALPVGNTPLGNGTYFIANVTVSISPTALNGTYVLDNTLSGGKTSVISDSLGHTFAIPEADYTVTVVPEPSTWAAGLLALSGIAWSQRRRLRRS